MMNPARFRNSGMIPCNLLCGGGVLSTKDTPLVTLDKDDWQNRRPLGYNEEGSLPNSQSELDEDMDIESDSHGSASPPPSPTDEGPLDSLHIETQKILYNLFREQAGGIKEAGGNQKALSTLRRVGAENKDFNKQNTPLFSSGMLQRLSIQTEDDIQKISEVPSMVFSDGVTNWGRIVTLISFGAFVAKHLKSIKLENCIRQLADNFTDYLMTQKREWIVQHNGWDGCVEFFHVEDYESGLRTVLMAFAGVAGLGASLAYMIR
ncbi:PREDICTED: induced myeloid leukemia cell differentiation protein Mcl-1 [Nanorana parkeri]|uniref:induced myeloid leukemia cell differentiation protein Mcl-1 n=1 Tax=Nanorana parkeri TaxID=125878 RepID=UPI0008547461|nr:PREDICTED: induced myeloid leukemia cell differentiation protein Mcl-1 [Nanorana parkeri]